MTERSLSMVLTKRFSRIAWTALAGYALVVMIAFAIAAEAALRASIEHSADVIQSLLVTYTDSTGGSDAVMPAALADQLVGMGGQVVITRVKTNATGMQEVYYLSPGMPAKRLEGLRADATPDEVRETLLAAIANRAAWKYRVLHRAQDPYDIYIVASRESYLYAFGVLMLAALALLPLAAITARRAASNSVVDALGPLESVKNETRAIGPADLGKRIGSPTGQAEVTELANSVNRMLERVERAHRALESFTADASHELRTPLTHLRGQVQWSSEDKRTPDEIREALMAMERELDRTTKMVEELLLIARGENQQLAMSREKFDLSAVVREVGEITEAMAVDRRIDVAVNVDGDSWAVGDADRTRHILLNLASNAIRYTGEGSVSFSISTNGSMIGATVADTGPGIADEHLDRIFDRFFRIDQSRSRELGGTGLGLAIARLLAELQGGTIEVSSENNQGSQFTLWLPRHFNSVSAD
ncbi:MAG: HAMP domain-containing sensor histidine kinase [Gemmatimonadales bacterium]